MTELDTNIEATPEQPPVTDPKPDTGSDISSIPEPVSPSPVVTAPPLNTVLVLPISHKETFWEKAKDDLEDAIAWLRAELEKL